MPSKKPTQAKRVTVSLSPAQKEHLKEIANRNNTTVAFVVRYALNRFLTREDSGQLRLEFPGTQADL